MVENLVCVDLDNSRVPVSTSLPTISYLLYITEADMDKLCGHVQNDLKSRLASSDSQ